MTRLRREWRQGIAAYWWHQVRGNNDVCSPEFHAEFVESDRRLQAWDARDRYRHSRRLASR